VWHLHEQTILASWNEKEVAGLLFTAQEAAPWFKQLLAGFPPRRPEFTPGKVIWALWWTKWHWGRFSPSTSVSPANHHSTKFSILIITRGRYNRLTGGRRAEWIQLDSNPHYSN
jgi:hypothetical protein